MTLLKIERVLLMERGYKVFDVQDNQLFVTIESHYFTRIEAKETYIKSKTSADEIDDSLLITVAKKDYSEVKAVVSFGIEEGERFALALLNLCQAIKY